MDKRQGRRGWLVGWLPTLDSLSVRSLLIMNEYSYVDAPSWHTAASHMHTQTHMYEGGEVKKPGASFQYFNAIIILRISHSFTTER